jgi:hypothetical protein
MRTDGRKNDAILMGRPQDRDRTQNFTYLPPTGVYA